MGVKPVNKEAIKNMKEIKIPKTLGGLPVISIGDHAFEDCDKLENITIPDSVTTIGDYAFYDCDGLNGKYEWNNIQSIGNYAFAKCTNKSGLCIELKSTSHTYIGDYCFAWSNGIILSLKSDLIIWGKGAYYSNSWILSLNESWGISSLDFGRSVSASCPVDFMRSCSNLQSVVVGNRYGAH